MTKGVAGALGGESVDEGVDDGVSVVAMPSSVRLKPLVSNS